MGIKEIDMIVSTVMLILCAVGFALIFAQRSSVKAFGYFCCAVAQLLNIRMISEDGYPRLASFLWVCIVVFLGAAANNFIKALSASKAPPQAKEDGK